MFSRPAASLAGVLVTAFWCIGVLPASTLPLTDPDTWWHIRAGEVVLDTGAVPTIDTWSIAGSGRPWTSQDWLSNVVLVAGYRLGDWGPTVLSVLYGMAGTGAVVLLWLAVGARRPSIGPLARSAWLLFGLVLAAPVLGVRVQVIDLLLAVGVIALLWRYLRDPRPTWLAGIPFLSLAWVNLHAGWPLLFLLGGAVLVGEGFDRGLRRPPDGHPLTWRALGWLATALVASAVVLAANPNGLAIYGYPFQTLGIGALSAFVGEWQPARLDAPAGQLLAALVLLGVIPALVLARHYLRTADALILLGLGLMALTAVRFLLVFGPIGAAIVCMNLAPAISGSKIGRQAAPVIKRLSRPRAGVAGAVNLALTAVVSLAGIGLAVSRITPAAQAAAVAGTYPVTAVDWLKSNEVGNLVFNRFEWGGYLGLERPYKPVFIDGRADVYGDSIIREYVEVISVNVDPQAYFDRYRIDHILYPTDSTLGRWLNASSGWEVAYADETASVWVTR